eukprot:COSAG04_NODE_1506_length_6504_cov_4.962998_1_plen_28_part_10
MRRLLAHHGIMAFKKGSVTMVYCRVRMQ